MAELLAAFPELPLLLAVCVAALLWGWVRRWLAGIAITVVVAIVVGVFLHEAWEAGALGCPVPTVCAAPDGAEPEDRRPVGGQEG
jgi:hypothetical protein